MGAEELPVSGRAGAKRKTMSKKKTTKRRLTARDAARAASGYYRDLTETHDRPTLEEIELNESGDRWLVTLGVYLEGVPFGERGYKRFEVDAYTGEVLSMKIRPR